MPGSRCKPTIPPAQAIHAQLSERCGIQSWASMLYSTPQPGRTRVQHCNIGLVVHAGSGLVSGDEKRKVRRSGFSSHAIRRNGGDSETPMKANASARSAGSGFFPRRASFFRRMRVQLFSIFARCQQWSHVYVCLFGCSVKCLCETDKMDLNLAQKACIKRKKTLVPRDLDAGRDHRGGEPLQHGGSAWLRVRRRALTLELQAVARTVPHSRRAGIRDCQLSLFRAKEAESYEQGTGLDVNYEHGNVFYRTLRRIE